jgi:hypothetical protein
LKDQPSRSLNIAKAPFFRMILWKLYKTARENQRKNYCRLLYDSPLLVDSMRILENATGGDSPGAIHHFKQFI